MIRSGFLNSEELEQITRRPSEDHGVARRANAILLLDDGFSCAQIAKVLYIDDDTVRTWHKHYMSGGFDELETFDWQGGKPYLSEVQAGELTDFLDRNLHRDTNQIRAHIRQTYAQFYSKSGCIKLLARLGFEYKKPKRIPAQADEENPRGFIEKYEHLQSVLPAYAPHLNPIERLWGVMHEYVTHNRYYPGFNEFAEAILAFFEKTVPKHWPDFRDRVSDNFRIISFQNFRVLE
jgi:transposase